MPDVSTLVIAGGAWTGLLVVACALCAAASRGEGPRGPRQQVVRARAAAPAIVADTGGIRARLRAAAGTIEAEQLAVTVDVGGADVVLASSRPVVLTGPGERPEIDVPVRLGGRTVATLRAVRAPGSRPFDDADRVALLGLAARVSSSMQAAREVRSDEPTALA